MPRSRQEIRKAGGRRTYAELVAALNQWRQAESGTKPVETIKTGFLSGGRLKGPLTNKQKAKREAIKEKLQAARQRVKSGDGPVPMTDVARKAGVKPEEPGTPTPPTKPKPEETGHSKPTGTTPPVETPPTKPSQRSGSVSGTRQAALSNLRKNKR